MVSNCLFFEDFSGSLAENKREFLPEKIRTENSDTKVIMVTHMEPMFVP